MRADKHGITLNRAELALIIAFTSEASGFNVGHFRTTSSGKLHVAASDGKRAVEGVGESEATIHAEWHITRQFLEQCRRATDEGETEIRLAVTEKGCSTAVLVGIDDGKDRNRIVDPTASTSTQTTMQKVLDTARCRRTEGGSWFAIHPMHVKDLVVVSAACEKCPVSFYPPEDPNGMLSFEASGERGRWGGVISTTPVVGPGDAAVDKDELEDDERPGESDEGKPLKLEPTLATAKRAKKPKASKARGGKARAGGRGKKNGATANGSAHDTEPPSPEEQPQA